MEEESAKRQQMMTNGGLDLLVGAMTERFVFTQNPCMFITSLVEMVNSQSHFGEPG